MGQKDFEAIYETYYDRIYKYVYSILLHKEDAEDVTAETFVAAYANFHRYDEQKASVATWLTRIAHNQAINLVRSAYWKKRSEMPDNLEAKGGEDFAEHAADEATIHQLYRLLSPEEREFLNFRYAMDMKDREIAQLLGLNEKTINKRYQRLLARCRELLERKID